MAKNTPPPEPIEKQLWKAADKLRKNIDAAEYKHVVLGLIFLKYISDAFEELFLKLAEGKGDYAGADPEDRDEYKAENVFFVPPSARWGYLQKRAKLPEIGKDVDAAMDAIERDNPSLKDVLPKVYARGNLDPTNLGGLIDLISNIALGDAKARSADLLGHVFEYFLGEFALAEGKKGGQFYTPRCVVELLVEMLEPYKGRVFDPCCGSGGMFVQSEKFVTQHQGNLNDISIYGQESNQTTWRLAKMNLAIRGIDSSQVKWNNEGSFMNDVHKDLKADFVIANPPFNDSDWSGDQLRTDGRWKYGTPPPGNANYAWIQHFLYHLSPNGQAGFVLSNSSLSAERTGDFNIRKNIIDADLIECIIVLPTNLFYNTSIPACLWFITRNKHETDKFRNRERDVLFIDARDYGSMLNKSHRFLRIEDIDKLTQIFHSWKNKGSIYSDVPELCKSTSIDTIKDHGYNLSPNLYIDLNLASESPEDNSKKINDFISTASDSERLELEEKIRLSLHELGYLELSKLNYSTINYHKLINLEKIFFRKWFFHFTYPTDEGSFPQLSITNNEDIRTLPIGWKLANLNTVSRVVDCLHSKKPENKGNSGFILLEVNNIGTDGTLELKETYQISESDYQKWTRNIEVTGGDCIITNTGRVGAVAQIPSNFQFAIGRNMTAIRPDQSLITPTFLINYLLSPYMFIETYRKTDIGTILDSLNVKGIKKLNIIIPPIELQKLYETFARPLRRLIEIGVESH